jgi:hypothetical protein
MARDGITYSPEKEKELIGLMSQYMKKAGMNSKEIRYYLSYDEDFISDQLSDLPKEGGDDFDDPDNPKNWGGDHNDQAAYDDRHKKEEVEMENSQYVVWYMVDDGQWDKKSTFNDEADADAYIERLVAKGYDDDNFEMLKPGEHPDNDYNYTTPRAMEGGRDAYQRDYDSSVSGMGRRERENDEGDTEPANNFAVSINGKQWKVFKGRGQYADDSAERNHYQQLRAWAAKKSESTGKKWEVNVTGAPATESIQRTQGESMSNLREGEVQQASAIVTAKTMVDRVSRWIEELSSMENDTLLQLGDSIRDEMGQEQAKAFISSVAPAIQQALENLKSTRETMATGVRQLTGEEQGAEMLGGEPAGMGGDEMGPAEPDAMNMDGDIGGEDEFAAAEPAAGGLGDAGREQRESINRSSSLLKVLAG